MKEFVILVVIFALLALLTEIVYVWGLCMINKHFTPKKRKTIIRVVGKDTFVGRPELDFDLHARKVDKLRFGDEK